MVVVSGPAGHGKSELGNHAVEILHRDHFSFAFRAEEFATSHLDETLHRAQVGSAQSDCSPYSLGKAVSYWWSRAWNGS